MKSHAKQVKSWVKCEDFKIHTPILEDGDPLCVYVKEQEAIGRYKHKCDRLCENVHSSHLVVIRETPV